MNSIYIIEHLELDLHEWCLIEYKHISKIVGKNNVWFTNIRNTDKNKIFKYGKVFRESVKFMNLEKACILDPETSALLTPKDSKQFNYFIFGGILGDSPPKKRTTPELTQFMKNASARNIGKEQFSTDNAVFVTKKVIEGVPLGKIKFVKEVEIRKNKIESTILPFRYPLVNGKPNISQELVDYLKNRED